MVDGSASTIALRAATKLTVDTPILAKDATENWQAQNLQLRIRALEKQIEGLEKRLKSLES